MPALIIKWALRETPDLGHASGSLGAGLLTGSITYWYSITSASGCMLGRSRSVSLRQVTSIHPPPNGFKPTAGTSSILGLGDGFLSGGGTPTDILSASVIRSLNLIWALTNARIALSYTLRSWRCA